MPSIKKNMRNSARQIFVGSSSEAEDLANRSVHILNATSTSTLAVSWRDAGWENLESILSNLVAHQSRFSYGLFIFYPDDQSTIRGQQYFQTRDNVVFEFGLFLSALRKERVFALVPRVRSQTTSIQPPTFRLLSDLGNSVIIETYDIAYDTGNRSFKASPQSFRRAVASIGKRILNIEAQLINGTTDLIGSKERFLSDLSIIKGQIGRLDSDQAKIGVLRHAIEELLQWKTIATNRGLTDGIEDLLLYLESIDDVLDIGQLAERQRASVSNRIELVSVFASKPLEYLDDTRDSDIDEQIKQLREVIISNLKKGVSYVYYVDVDFDLKRIRALLEDVPPAARKNLSVCRVNKFLFKTFFTIHHMYDGTHDVYMSALMQNRKDLLIKVGPSHADRIRNGITRLRGEASQLEGINVVSFF